MRLACTAALVCVFAACGDDTTTLRPVIDVPPAGSDSYPLDTVDALVLSVAHSGDTSDIQISSSTVDDPPTLSQVPFGDDLVLHLRGEASGVELAYGRSCAFTAPDPDLVELHLYFSRIVKWGPVAAPAELPTRIGGHGYAIGDGNRAVFLGGGARVTKVEVFDALATGGFTAFPTGVPARQQAVLAPFGNGRALLVGGLDVDGVHVDRAQLVDPTGATLELDDQTGPLLTGHTAATLVDGTVVVAGGRTPDGVTNKAWRFRTVGASELDVPDELFETLDTARADHTMTRLGSEVGADVLIVGGRADADLPIAQTELFRPLRESFEVVDGALLIVPRWGHRAVRMPGGFVLIIGGYAPEPVTKLELYDPSQGVFLDAGDMPAGAGLNDLTVTRLADGRVLLAGGVDDAGAPVAAAYIARLDPIDGRVVVAATDSMGTPRAGHTAVVLCDGTILVVGGTEDERAHAERYNPPSAGRR